MGADGGVEWVKLRDPKKYNRLVELLLPFWQIGWRGDKSGCAGYNVDKHLEWMDSCPSVCPPNYLLGFYGTDRGDACSLETLCTMLESEDEEPATFTFAEFDEYYRLTIDETWDWRRAPWNKCWTEHFQYKNHEEVCEELGPLKDMKISDWVEEIRAIIDLRFWVMSAETWT